MNLRIDFLSRYLEMKKDLEEEQRKSAMSRIQSQALKIVLDKRNRRIVQLGALSSKICETIKKEREEKRKLQLQYCPETLEAEGIDSDDRETREMVKLFEDDKVEGGVKLYIQNTEYKQIVLNVKDLTDICEVTTDSEAENELTSLDTEETKKKKKKKSKKLSKMQSKQKLPVPPATSQPSKRNKNKKHLDAHVQGREARLVTARRDESGGTEADLDAHVQGREARLVTARRDESGGTEGRNQ